MQSRYGYCYKYTANIRVVKSWYLDFYEESIKQKSMATAIIDIILEPITLFLTAY